MSLSPPEKNHDDRLEAIIAGYLESLAAGKTIDRERTILANADLADDLRAFFADHDRMTEAASAMRHPPAGEDNSPAHGPESPAEPFPQPFGDYELLEEIGRGGMGVVYKARQISLNRIVALKRIRAGQLASAEDIARFQREAIAAAGLNHPHIVPIYEVGEQQGQHYFTMKLIEGGNLNANLGQYAADAKTTAQLMIQIARAVHHAHQRGILHRDLKPGNILIDAAGNPHVSDFGLAEPLEKEAKLTQSGAIVGTPEFMAPEQARGEMGLTTAADVYGLGAILYVLLTATPPFQGDYNWETLKKVVEEEPHAPRSINRNVNRDLETICLKCLKKEPGTRYGSAEAIAEDLERWRDNKPIVARPVTRRERLWKWARRRPAAAALLVVSVVSLVLVLGGGSALLHRLEDALDKATTRGEQLAVANDALAARTTALDEKRIALTDSLDRSRHLAFTSQLLRAGALYKTDPKQALDLLHDREVCSIDLCDPAWRFLERSCQKRLEGTHIGDLVVIGGGRLVRLAGNGKTVVMDLLSGRVEAEAPDAVNDPWGITANGRTLYRFEDSEGNLLFGVRHPKISDECVTLQNLFDGKSRRVKLDLIHRKPTPATKEKWGDIQRQFVVMMSPDGNVLADRECNHGTGVWLLETDSGKGKQRLTEVLASERNGICASTFSPDGRYLAIAGSHIDKRGSGILILDAKTGKEVCFFPYEWPLRRADMNFSNDGQSLVALAGSKAGSIEEMCCYDLGKAQVRFRTKIDWGTNAFSCDDRLLAVVSGSDVHIWDVQQGKEVGAHRFRRPGSPYHVGFSPDSERLVIRRKDEVEILAIGDWHSTILPIPGSGWASLTAEGKILAHTGDDGDNGTGLYSWDFDPPAHLASFQAHWTGRDLNWIRLNARDFYGNRSVDVVLDAGWMAEPGMPIGQPDNYKLINGAYFCPNGRYLAVVARAELRVLEIATGKERLRLPGTVGAQPVFLADGERLARLRHNKDPKGWFMEPELWNLQTGKQELWPKDLDWEELRSKARKASGLDDNYELVFKDGGLKILDPKTKEQLVSFRSSDLPGYESIPIAFSRDRRTLLIRSGRPHWENETLDLRDAKTGRLLNRYELKYQDVQWQDGHVRKTAASLTVCPYFKSLVEVRPSDRALEIIDLRTGRPRAVLSTDGVPAVGARFNDDATLLATWDQTGLVRIWDLRPPFEHARLPWGHPSWGKDDSTLAVLGQEKIRLVDMSTGQSLDTADVSRQAESDLVKTLQRFPPLPPIRALRSKDRVEPYLMLSADRKLLVNLDWELITVTDLASDKLKASLQVDFHPVIDRFLPILSPTGEWLAYAGVEGIKVVNLFRAGATTTIKRGPTCLAFDPEGKLLAIGTDDGLELFDSDTGKLIKQIVKGKEWQRWTSVAFSPDGKTLAATLYPRFGGRPGALRFWDLASWEPGDSIPLWGVASRLVFSPSGRYLAAGSWSGKEGIVWDLSRRHREFKGAP